MSNIADLQIFTTYSFSLNRGGTFYRCEIHQQGGSLGTVFSSFIEHGKQGTFDTLERAVESLCFKPGTTDEEAVSLSKEILEEIKKVIS